MSIVNGYIDWAKRDPGPPHKVYSQANAAAGIVCHSVVGYTGGSDRLGRVFDPNERMSVMFYLRIDGRLIQYYPVTASTWTSGNRSANTKLWAIELEGGPPGNYGEPINAAQLVAMQNLTLEWERHTGRKATRGGAGIRVMFGDNPAVLHPADRTVWEHNEVVLWDIVNSGPTACPSHRYDRYFAWLATRTGEEIDMTVDEVKDIVKAELAANDAGDVRAADFLEYLAQAVGAKESTFSDSELVALVRAKLAEHSETRGQAGGEPPAPGTRFTVEVVS